MEDDWLYKLKTIHNKIRVKCRENKGEHWTSKCPYKEYILTDGKVPVNEKPVAGRDYAPRSAIAELNKAQGSKSRPPSVRNGGNRRGNNRGNRRGKGRGNGRGKGRGNGRGNAKQSQHRNYSTAICISNLSEDITAPDLERLVKPFGFVQKLYLAKDRTTKLCKGFAYVHFKTKAEAARAISHLNGYGYDHLILSVDWSQPPAQQK